MLILYDMLDNTVYCQKVLILENNNYDQNMPLYYGDVEGARSDETVWDWLTKQVELYEYCFGVLVIRVRNENFADRLEKHYFGSDRWTESNRPWLHSSEIRKYIEQQDGRGK